MPSPLIQGPREDSPQQQGEQQQPPLHGAPRLWLCSEVTKEAPGHQLGWQETYPHSGVAAYPLLLHQLLVLGCVVLPRFCSLLPAWVHIPPVQSQPQGCFPFYVLHHHHVPPLQTLQKKIPSSHLSASMSPGVTPCNTQMKGAQFTHRFFPLLLQESANTEPTAAVVTNWPIGRVCAISIIPLFLRQESSDPCRPEFLENDPCRNHSCHPLLAKASGTLQLCTVPPAGCPFVLAKGASTAA